MGDRAQIMASFGGRQGPDSEQIEQSFGGGGNSGGGSQLPLALRQVATRSSLPVSPLGTGNTKYMAVSGHVARDTISAIEIGIANAVFGAGGETGTGGTATVTASIEYPIGTTPTRLTFAGATSGSGASGTIIFSDLVPLPVPIPNGAKFRVRVFYSNPAGVVFSSGFKATPDDLVVYGSSATDLTGTTATTNLFGPATTMTLPVAILGMTRVPSVALAGDSRVFGLFDVADTTGDVGELARAIGPSFGYINMGVPSTSTINFQGASGALRRQLSMFCSHVVVQMGINDLSNGNVTTAQMTARQQQTLATLQGQRVFLCTLPPFSNSSDSFATIANESAPSWDSYRTGYNAAVRAGTIAPWVMGYFDITSAVESAFESGKWGGSDGVTPNYQAGDGKHESQAGALAIKASGVINPAVFTPALPPLQALSVSTGFYPHGAAAGTVIGTISGKSFGTTLSLSGDSYVALGADSNGNPALVVGASGAPVGYTANYTITESRADDGATKATALPVRCYTGSPWGDHAYWAIRCKTPQTGGSSWAVAELEFHASPGGAQLATGGNSFADINQSGTTYNDPKAFDGSLGTMWFPNNTTAGVKLGYRFSSPVSVGEVKLGAFNNATYVSGMPTSFDVMYSDDGVNFNTAWSVSGASWTAASQVTSFIDPAYTTN